MLALILSAIKHGGGNIMLRVLTASIGTGILLKKEA